MKFLVILTVYFALVRADSSNTQDVKPKPTQKTLNSLPTAPKQEYFQPMQYHHVQPQTQYVQLVPKPVYVPHHQQPAMIIIAQPAYLPANVVYGSATQQLLHYFHNNPQARYQLLHGNYQPQQHLQQHIQQPQQHHHYVQPATVASPSIGSYQIVAAPAHYHHHNLIASPSNHLPFSQASPLHNPQIGGHYTVQQQPVQLSQIAHLAQLAAQQYTAPIRTAPPIITGFENFTPEQQVKIKQQLSAHFGTPLQPLQSKSQIAGYLSSPQLSSAQYSEGSSASGGSQQAQYSVATSPQQAQYSSRYQAPQATSTDFVPSQQIKNDIASEGNQAENAKTQYVKM